MDVKWNFKIMIRALAADSNPYGINPRLSQVALKLTLCALAAGSSPYGINPRLSQVDIHLKFSGKTIWMLNLLSLAFRPKVSTTCPLWRSCWHSHGCPWTTLPSVSNVGVCRSGVSSVSTTSFGPPSRIRGAKGRNSKRDWPGGVDEARAVVE